MKRKLLLFLSFFVTMTMMAGPVTKDEAAQKAQAFVNGKNKQFRGLKRLIFRRYMLWKTGLMEKRVTRRSVPDPLPCCRNSRKPEYICCVKKGNPL